MSRKLVEFSQRCEYPTLVGENFPDSLSSDYWKMHYIVKNLECPPPTKNLPQVLELKNTPRVMKITLLTPSQVPAKCSWYKLILFCFLCISLSLDHHPCTDGHQNL